MGPDAKLERAVASIIEEGKHVTYDMKPDRNDPTAAGTREMARRFCRAPEIGRPPSSLRAMTSMLGGSNVNETNSASG